MQQNNTTAPLTAGPQHKRIPYHKRPYVVRRRAKRKLAVKWAMFHGAIKTATKKNGKIV